MNSLVRPALQFSAIEGWGCVYSSGLIVQTPLLIADIFAGLILLTIVVLFELEKTPKQESEMIKREDKVMSATKDDPHEPARWVP